MQGEWRRNIFSVLHALGLLTDQGGQVDDEVFVLPVFNRGVDGAEPTTCVARRTQRCPIGRVRVVAPLMQVQSRPLYVATLFPSAATPLTLR